MNKKIKIKNFKCYSAEKEITMSKITACVGMNSVGKSSFIQSILLIRQVFDNIVKYKGTKTKKFTVSLNDAYSLHLGTTKQIFSGLDQQDITFLLDDRYNFVFTQKQNELLSMNIECHYSYEELAELQGIFYDKLYYLNAERMGPRNYQKMERQEYVHCGYHGECTYQAVKASPRLIISKQRLCKFESIQTVNTLEKQIEYWMNYIVPGVGLKFDEQSDLRISSFQVMQQALDTGFSSPYNYGFGISYILPVIVTGLIAEKESMFIVENPEAHLHPSGQSRIGRFLGMIAADGVQVVVETHSEHVINGIRLAALHEGLSPDDICINYFSIDDKSGKNKVERIMLNQRMDLTSWPEGFFDQEEKDLRELRELRRK